MNRSLLEFLKSVACVFAGHRWQHRIAGGGRHVYYCSRCWQVHIKTWLEMV